MKTLCDLFLDELADRYDAERRMVKAFAKLAKAATCNNLRHLIRSHMKETELHVLRLGRVFATCGETPVGKRCEVTLGLLKESDELTANFKGTSSINAAIISIVQKAEHYEIASYGCLREWARLMGNDEAAWLLQDILVEEKSANHLLSELARFKSNEDASAGFAGADSRNGAPQSNSKPGKRGGRSTKPKRTRRIPIPR